MVKLISKNSNLCDHNLPSYQRYRQTDGQTDVMRSQYRALHLSESRGKNDAKKTWPHAGLNPGPGTPANQANAIHVSEVNSYSCRSASNLTDSRSSL